MSVQCWCYQCAGKVVHRNTWRNHGRKDKPDEPLRKKRCLSPPAIAPVAHEDEYEAPQAEPLDDVPFMADPLGLVPDADSSEEEEATIGTLTASEAMLFLLDWMCTHKVRALCSHVSFPAVIIYTFYA